MKFETLKDEYAHLWASMAIRSSFKPALDLSANKIIANKDRYAAVSEMTKVPWYVIGLIHQMEAGGSFGCHLHNGDGLAQKTIHVPKNRPAAGYGPFKWEASACDALILDGLHKVKSWTIERIAFELESFNGWGHRKFHKDVLTPYLWSGTTHYARGKYVADNKWDANAVSEQTGAMPLLKRMMELDGSIQPSVAEVEAKPLTPQETVSDSFVKANEKAPVSKPAVATGAAVSTGAVITAAPEIVKAIPPVPEVITQSIGSAEAWKATGQQVWTFGGWLFEHPTQSVPMLLVVLGLWFLPSFVQKHLG